ncbi:pantoate-beta-alanine ligase [Diplodia corticola]|uniref:Pantoate--beta-alanine ligase n=1 Tax=Diplodia corticola TaxID=236234 RepID=A0A1J9RGN2_9PEZI|nr:pantoate-beta-alanine ligase [Diplodia corticola]OJD40702.1 pantoate-beta-alanine ligase [Diplodia corticola]
MAGRSPFRIFREVAPLRAYRREQVLAQKTVGMVPTMGALHAGHLSLVRQAAAETDDIYLSIYVNPTQFGVNEDLDSYPKTWDADLDKLRALDAELHASSARGRIKAIFAPTSKIMYPTLPPSSDVDGHGSFVTITPLAKKLEGASRPVFFRGVATVCTKLFNIVQPDKVYFGQKDVQQTVIIRRMVEDFHIPTQVRIGPTEREADGLAMSSRNVYLGARRRKVSTVLSRALWSAEEQYTNGKRKRDDILWPAHDLTNNKIREQEELQPKGRALFDVDYISLADPNTLEEVDAVDEKKGAILSAAIKMQPTEDPQPGEDLGLGGGQVPVRLIDNIILKPLV